MGRRLVVMVAVVVAGLSAGADRENLEVTSCSDVCESNYRANNILCNAWLYYDYEWCDIAFPGDNEPWSPNWVCRRAALKPWGDCIREAESTLGLCLRGCPGQVPDPAE